MSERTTMNGKPVFTVPAKTVINFDSGFKPKLLCDGPTFTAGTACPYSCTFCYVPAQMLKQKPWLEKQGVTGKHEDIVIRRSRAAATARQQLLTHSLGERTSSHVIYASPLTDVAANMELVRETVEICKVILELTNWHIRLLSKSNLLPKVAEGLADVHWNEDRVIYGVSTGTLDDSVGAAIEVGTPKISKRIESLHWLQDNGYRTFGMICPSLPQTDYDKFALDAYKAIRGDRCEHVWAEVINLRGDSFKRTIGALQAAKLFDEAGRLIAVSTDKKLWEEYARATFLAHMPYYRTEQFRFLQYVTKDTESWWKERNAVLL